VLYISKKCCLWYVFVTCFEKEVGTLKLDSSEEEFSVMKPPDGGKRAWLIVLACSALHFCTTLVTKFVDITSHDLCENGKQDMISMILLGSDIHKTFKCVSKVASKCYFIVIYL